MRNFHRPWWVSALLTVIFTISIRSFHCPPLPFFKQRPERMHVSALRTEFRCFCGQSNWGTSFRFGIIKIIPWKSKPPILFSPQERGVPTAAATRHGGDSDHFLGTEIYNPRRRRAEAGESTSLPLQRGAVVYSRPLSLWSILLLLEVWEEGKEVEGRSWAPSFIASEAACGRRKGGTHILLLPPPPPAPRENTPRSYSHLHLLFSHIFKSFILHLFRKVSVTIARRNPLVGTRNPPILPPGFRKYNNTGGGEAG